MVFCCPPLPKGLPPSAARKPPLCKGRCHPACCARWMTEGLSRSRRRGGTLPPALSPLPETWLSLSAYHRHRFLSSLRLPRFWPPCLKGAVGGACDGDWGIRAFLPPSQGPSIVSPLAPPPVELSAKLTEGERRRLGDTRISPSVVGEGLAPPAALSPPQEPPPSAARPRSRFFHRLLLCVIF